MGQFSRSGCLFGRLAEASESEAWRRANSHKGFFFLDPLVGIVQPHHSLLWLVQSPLYLN